MGDCKQDTLDVNDLTLYNDSASVLQGAALLGSAVKVLMLGETNDSDVFVLTRLVMVEKNMQQALVAAFCFRRENGVFVKNESDVSQAWGLFTQIQNNLRTKLEMILNPESAMRKFEKSFEETPGMRMVRERQEINKIAQEQQAAHVPHEMGTVAEIAAKYNISKSEVRRRKAEGTLHELKEQ